MHPPTRRCGPQGNLPGPLPCHPPGTPLLSDAPLPGDGKVSAIDPDAREGHLILGQGAGLVRTDHRG